NAPSHLDSAVWIDRSLDLVKGIFDTVKLRGDTDFGLTAHFDKWDELCTFVLGMDARPNLVKLAKSLTEWDLLERKPRHTVKTRKRRQPENIKKAVVKKRKFKTIQTVSEYLSEFSYKPGKCKKPYRMIVLKKILKVTKGELKLFDDVRYFFYITNDAKNSKEQILEFYRKRADHENDIEQLKNGACALKAPSNTLLSNWAYMAIASTAWDLKAWYGLLMPYRHLGKRIVRMEFKRFIHTFIRIPCLIIRTGRKIVYRLVGYNHSLKHALNCFHALKQFNFP
ncbi:MAG: transposase, partial [Desulfatirhabdiaceae bacterium]